MWQPRGVFLNTTRLLCLIKGKYNWDENMDKKEEQTIIGSILLIVFGVLFILPMGVNLVIMHITMSVLGGSSGSVYLLIIGIILIGVGYTCILYPKRYKIRYLVGAAFSFFYSINLFIIYFTFIPQMKELANSYKDSGTEGGTSGLQPGNVDFVFYETFVLALISVFILIGISLIFMYVRSYLNNENTTILEAKYL